MRNQKMRVLYVDNISENYFYMESLLAGSDVELFTAANGIEALELMRTQQIDLVVTDVMMPEMDGFTFCREVVADARLKRTPIIVFTGTYTSAQDAELAKQLGVDAYITKPCEPILLLNRILELGARGKQSAIPDFSDSEKEENVLRLFNRQLVRKLEQKTAALEEKIRENERTMDSLKKNEDMLNTTQELAKLGGWEYHIDTRKMYWTEQMCKMRDRDPKDNVIIMDDFRVKYVDAKDQEVHSKLFKKMMIDGESFVTEFWLEENNGDHSFYRVAAEYDAEKRVVLGIMQNLTERKQIEIREESLKEQLRQAQKLEAIGQLAGGIAHDFNNVLTVILGYAEEILDELHPGEPMRDDVAEIIEAADRAGGLTRQLLTFSSKQEYQPKLININDTLTNLQKLLNRLIGEDVQCTIEFTEDIQKILADEGQIEQVIMNLVINAREAMPMGGKITIRTFIQNMTNAMMTQHSMMKEKSYAVMTIEDTGCGMSQSVLKNIFDPFFSTKDRGYSSGLGLSTVYGIVKQHGGHIRADSTPGRGAIFAVMFPIAAEQKEEPAEAAEDLELIEKRGKILVVEDDRAVGELTAKILLRTGYEAYFASGAVEALKMIDEQHLQPDLVIIDVVMPEMNGMELAAALHFKHPQIKLLLMSGYTQKVIAQQGERIPGIPFMHKPFTREELTRRVSQILKKE